MSRLRVEALSAATHDAVRQLILAGLADHWGELDETLNPDLDNLFESYGHGRTLVVLDEHEAVIGTGTIVPRGDRTAEILRMSVSRAQRRGGVGRMLVDELIAIACGWLCDRVILETSTAWTEVVTFYQYCGFAITHLEDGEFGSDTWFERRIGPDT